MNRKIALPGCFLLLLVSLVSPLFPGDDQGAAAKKNFVMSLGGEENNDFTSAIRTTKGSYVSITSHGVIREISKSGHMFWQRTMSMQLLVPCFTCYWWFNGIAEVDHGYVLVGGIYDGSDLPINAVIAKLGGDGTVQWSKRFESTTRFAFNSVSSTADGGFISRGTHFDDSKGHDGVAVVKFTANGEIVWSKIFDDLISTWSQPVSDGIIVASTGNTSGSFRIFKVNDSGSIVWKKSLEINGFNLDSMGLSTDNGVILAGRSSNLQKLMLVRVDGHGKAEWTASYLFNVNIGIGEVTQTSDGGYVITGSKWNGNYGQNTGGVIIKIDSNRKLVFHNQFGRADRNEYSGPTFSTTNGGYMIFGGSYWWESRFDSGSDMLLLNVNSEGSVLGCNFFHELRVKKGASFLATSRTLELSSRSFSVTASTFEASSAVSTSPSSSACAPSHADF